MDINGSASSRRSTSSRTRKRVWTAAIAAVAAAVGVVAAAAPVSAAGHPRPARTTVQGDTSSGTAYAQLSRRPAARGRAVHYAVPRHLCGQPTHGRVSCDAIRLIPATQGTAGAKAYVSPTTTTGPAGGYTPADLASAYGYDPAATVHQTVAVVDAYNDPHALSDLNRFDRRYGLAQETATSFRKVNQSGKASPLPAANSGWAGEIALDIETVRAVCHTCKIVLVEATSSSNGNLAAGVNTAARLGATEISNSYGSPEYKKAPATIQRAYNHPGVVITASTGDDGWYGWDFANKGSKGASDNAPNVPSAYPSVVAVGGTALSLNPDGTRNQENVWNENGPDDQHGLAGRAQGASGGGCSSLYAAPSWQAAVAGYSRTGCGTKRLAADVSALADPYTGFDIYDSYSGGWVTAGGTSLSSPLVASMWALAGGAHGVAYPGESLYDNLKLRASSVYDVAAGGNGFCGGDSHAKCSAAVEALTSSATGNPNNLANGNPYYQGGWAGLLDCGYAYRGGESTKANDTQCNAVAGYDGAGVGAPTGLTLFSPTRPTVSIHAPSALKLHAAATWSASGFHDPLGAALTGYTWNWGDGSAATRTTSTSVTHTFTAAGTHVVTVTVTDSLGQRGSAKASVTVGVKPSAVIGGRTKLHVRTLGTWTSRRSSDPDTGGRIVSRTWELDGKKVGTSTTWSHRFAKRGKHKLTLVVVDNTGLHATKSVTLTVTR